MEPTGKFMQQQAVSGKAGPGLARSPLAALQGIEFKAKLTTEPGKFLGLLRAETVRAELKHQHQQRPSQGTAASPRRPDTPPGHARAEGAEPAAKGHCGKASPREDQPLPPPAERGTCSGHPAEPPGEEEAAGAVPGNAGADAQPGTGAGEPAQAAAADEPELADAEADVEVAVPADPTEEAGIAGGDDAALEAAAIDPDEEPLPTIPASDAAESADVAERADADVILSPETTIAGTGENAGEAVPAPGADPEPADPDVAASAANPASPTARAAERVAENLARNPEAAAAGLQRAQEAISRQGPPASMADEASAARQPAAAAGGEMRSAQTVSLDLRAPEASARPSESGGAARAPELAPPAAPRAQPTAEMPVQLRMPAVAAEQVEKALAARNPGAGALDARAAAGTPASNPATAAAGVASNPASVAAAEAAKASLQHARASFARPGWDAAMAQRVAQLAARGVQSAQIEVDPPELGPVRVVIHVSNDQQTSVSFSSPNAGVREALEQTAQRLRDAMAEAGLDLADVNVSDHSADQRAAERDTGTGRGNAGGGVVQGEAADDETMVSVTVRDSDALVDQYV